MFTVKLPVVTAWLNSSVTFTLIVTLPAVLSNTVTIVVVFTLLSVNVLFAVMLFTYLFPEYSTVILYVPSSRPVYGMLNSPLWLSCISLAYVTLFMSMFTVPSVMFSPIPSTSLPVMMDSFPTWLGFGCTSIVNVGSCLTTSITSN